MATIFVDGPEPYSGGHNLGRFRKHPARGLGGDAIMRKMLRTYGSVELKMATDRPYLLTDWNPFWADTSRLEMNSYAHF